MTPLAPSPLNHSRAAVALLKCHLSVLLWSELGPEGPSEEGQGRLGEGNELQTGGAQTTRDRDLPALLFSPARILPGNGGQGTEAGRWFYLCPAKFESWSSNIGEPWSPEQRGDASSWLARRLGWVALRCLLDWSLGGPAARAPPR